MFNIITFNLHENITIVFDNRYASFIIISNLFFLVEEEKNRRVLQEWQIIMLNAI